MIHAHRTFCVKAYDTPEVLAKKLTQHTWTLCSGFQLGELLFLNDSFSEDGASEYAVIKNGQQIESITLSWCTEADALRSIHALQSGALSTPMGPVTPRIEPAGQHRCRLCA